MTVPQDEDEPNEACSHHPTHKPIEGHLLPKYVFLAGKRSRPPLKYNIGKCDCACDDPSCHYVKVATENVWAMRGQWAKLRRRDSVSFKRALDDISSSESSLEADLFREGSPISSYQLVPWHVSARTITESPGVAVRQSLRRPMTPSPGVAVGQSLRIWQYRRRTGDGTGRVDGEAGGDFLGAGTGLGSATTGRVTRCRKVNLTRFPSLRGASSEAVGAPELGAFA
ncbi:hypothetical protein BSL78_03559 [Apostichopus japonicus]|uniref:Uncharacterized protein n=1 Tax=Stichopus japonicus TaxID=307972 RepID=A0A2G8LGV6_STIJA|nr:hypothetical protein BSL78_03559 [Apostichopus japonicus]